MSCCYIYYHINVVLPLSLLNARPAGVSTTADNLQLSLLVRLRLDFGFEDSRAASFELALRQRANHSFNPRKSM
jgi:hypothetical protein